MSDTQHSVAHRGNSDDSRLFAPAAARNAEPILQALRPHLPSKGRALEIASGTGEHVVHIAAATPGLTWQPTDIDPDRLASIAAWTEHSGATNITAPMAYDGVANPWPGECVEVVFLSNLLHLISQAGSQALLTHMAQALLPGGLLAIYGPFKRDDGYASDGDARFDAAIRAERPQAGYKAIADVENRLATSGLTRVDRLNLPANNLLTVWRRPP